MADKPQGSITEEQVKNLMLEVNLDTFELCSDKVLIYHDKKDVQDKTEGGVFLSDAARDEIRKAAIGMITSGVIVATGPDVKNPNIAVGRQAIFYRQNSEGGIKGTDGQVYVIFGEYHIIGTLPAPDPVTVTATGEIENLN